MPTTGITVSRDGRKFSNYPPGLDANNTNDGSNNKYTVAELIGNSTERPYPSAEINNPPGGAINYSTYPASKSSVPKNSTQAATKQTSQRVQTTRTTSSAYSR
jgi:hypothetical protein